MTRDKLQLLHDLLDELIHEPDWLTSEPAWQSLVEANRQVAIELQEVSP